MALLGHDEDDPPPLLPQPSAQTLEGKGLARAGGAADPAVAVGVFVVVIGVQEHRGAVIQVQPQKNPVAVAELIGGKGERRRYAGGEGVASGFALHVRVQGQQGERREECLLVLVVAAASDHVNGHAQFFHRRHPLLQGLRVIGGDFHQGVHIVKVFPLPIHHVFEIQPGVDGAVQLLIVLTGVPHIPHPGAVHHGGLRDFGQDFLLGLPLDGEAQADALPGLHQRGQPAGAHGGGVAVPRHVEVSVVHPVHQDVVPALGVDGGGRQDIQDGGGARLQLGQVGFFLAKQQAFDGVLLGFGGVRLLFGPLDWGLCCFLLHRVAPHLMKFENACLKLSCAIRYF